MKLKQIVIANFTHQNFITIASIALKYLVIVQAMSLNGNFLQSKIIINN